MSNLGSQQINATYGYLLQIPGGLTSSLVTVQDGSGNNLPLSISTTGATGTFTGGTINGMVIGGVNPAAGTFTTLSASSTFTLSGGTANGVLYLNGSKAVTSGTALVFDGTNFSTTGSATATALIPSGSTVPTNGMFLRAANTVAWSTNTAERMRIDSSGNLLVGTTDNGGAKLKVLGAGNVVCGSFDSNSTTLTSLELICGANNTTQQGLYVYSIANTLTNAIIYSNGNIVNRNNSYGAISDAKLKTNIVDASPKLDDLMQVKVRNYNLIGSETRQLGVVAQELETVFPSMIDESPDLDSKGNDLGTTTKSVKYSVFVPMLIKAIQELSAKVTELESKLNS